MIQRAEILHSPSLLPSTQQQPMQTPTPNLQLLIHSFPHSEVTICSYMEYTVPNGGGSLFNHLKVLWSPAPVTTPFGK